jgi:hypothetical protein
MDEPGGIPEVTPSEGVRAEFSLTALAYNLHRALNIVEFPRLLAALQA